MPVVFNFGDHWIESMAISLTTDTNATIQNSNPVNVKPGIAVGWSLILKTVAANGGDQLGAPILRNGSEGAIQIGNQISQVVAQVNQLDTTSRAVTFLGLLFMRKLGKGAG